MAGNSTVCATFRVALDDKGLQDLIKGSGDLRKALEAGIEPADELRTRLINFNEASRALDNAAQAVEGINSVIQDLAAAYQVQEEAELKLAVVMRQRMQATEEDIQAIKDLTAAQQKLGVIGDEVQLSGAQQLATFLQQRGALEELIPAMNNLLVQQNGLNVTQTDAVGIANMMGKAMQGQVSALTRAGISMTDAEEASFKAGNEMERAAALARIITNNVGQMNAELAKTDAGRQKQLADALGDIKEQAGEPLKMIAPYAALASQTVTIAVNFGKLGNYIKRFAASVFQGTGLLSAFRFQTEATSVAMRALGVAIRAAVSATVIGAAIEGLIWLFGKLTGSVNDASEAAGEFGDEANQAAAKTDYVGEAQRQAAEKVQTHTNAIEALVKIAEDETRSLSQRLDAVNKLNSVIPGFNGQINATTGAFTRSNDALKTYLGNLERYYTLIGMQEMMGEAGKGVAEAQVEANRKKKYYEEKAASARAARSKANKARERNDPSYNALAFYAKSAENIAAMARSAWMASEGAVKLARKDLDEIKDAGGKDLEDLIAGQYRKPDTTIPSATRTGSAPRHTTPTRSAQSTEREETELARVNNLISEKEAAYMKADTATRATLREEISLLHETQAELEKLVAEANRPLEIVTDEDIRREETYLRALMATTRDLEKRGEIGRRIAALHPKAEVIKEEDPNPEKTSRISQLSKLGAPAYKSGGSPLAGMGLKSVDSMISEIRNLLSGMDGDITAEQRKSLEKTMRTLTRYRRSLVSTWGSLRQGWGVAKSLTGTITSLSQTLKGNAPLWDKIAAGVDAVISVVDGITALIGIIKMIASATKGGEEATRQSSEASTETIATTAGLAVAKLGEAAASKALTEALLEEAAAAIFAAHAYIPFAGAGIATGMVTEMLTTVKGINAAGAFAEGGIVYGPTLGLIGEYAGAKSNPEVIAPLDKLRSLVGVNGGGDFGEVEFRIKDRELVGMVRKANKRRART